MTNLDYLTRKIDRATMTPDQLGHEANLSPTHIRRLCQKGVINAKKIGDRWIIPIAAAAAFLDGESN